MPLHPRSTVRDQLLDSVFAGQDLSTAVPKYAFPPSESRPDVAIQVVHDELMLDGNARQKPRDVSARPGRSRRCTSSWTSASTRTSSTRTSTRRRPSSSVAASTCSPTSGTRRTAAIPSAARRSAARRPACSPVWPPSGAGERAAPRRASRSNRPNLVCGPVQVVWHKFAKYWDVELREIPMREGALCMTPEDMLEHVDEHTICVVPTFGVTYTGAYEPVQALSEALDDLHARTGLDVDLHIDGRAVPSSPRSAHRTWCGTFASRASSRSARRAQVRARAARRGWVVWRDEVRPARGPDLPRELPRRRHAGVPDQLLAPGRAGRRAVLRLHPPRPRGVRPRAWRVYATAQWIAGEIAQLGPFEVLFAGDPEEGIPCVTWRIAEGADPGYTL